MIQGRSLPPTKSFMLVDRLITTEK